MKKKLSVRAFQSYLNEGTVLSFRAFDPEWKGVFPEDSKKARKLWEQKEHQDRCDAFAEAMLLSNGDTIEAEAMLVNQLIAPPSFTTICHCLNCGILPAKPRIQSGEETLEPFCPWCGVIS